MTAVEKTGQTTGPTSVDDPSIQYQKPVRVPKQELDKDAFLQLLVAQMRYQDPSSPMDMNGLMQQTSMMTTVEKLTELAATSRSQFMMQQQIAAAAMVGHEVSWLDDEGKNLTGAVTAVNIADGKATLQVANSDKAVAWEQVKRVAQPGSAPADHTTDKTPARS